MAWNLRMYYDTRFNSINVPDSEATLEKAAVKTKDFPVIDCIQRYHLNTITIRAFEDDVILGDYVKIWDDSHTNKFAFYSINGYNFTSGDVCDLDVTMDPLLTCGGVDNIEFLDGVTVRHHVSQDDDIFGEYTEEDEMLVPTHPIRKELVASYYNDVKMDLFVNSQYGLDTDINIYQPNTLITASGTGEQGGAVTYSGYTSGLVNIQDSGIYNKTSTIFVKDGNEVGGTPAVTRCFRFKSTDSLNSLTDNIKKLVECGRSDIVENAYFVPSEFVVHGVTVVEASGKDRKQLESIRIPLVLKPYMDLDYLGFRGYDFKNSQSFPTVASSEKYGNFARDYAPIEIIAKTSFGSYLIKNKRVAYGSHTAYTFVAPSSGDSVTINPEQLLYGENPSDYKYPQVYASIDVRPNGCATFYIPTIGTDYDEGKPTYPTKIKSATWPKADIVTVAGNGSTINRALFENKSVSADLATEAEHWASVNKRSFVNDLPIIGDTARFLRNVNNEIAVGNADHFLTSNITAGSNVSQGLNMSPYDSQLNKFLNLYTSGRTKSKDYFERALAKQNELNEFYANNIPQVQIISKSDGADANMLGYGVLIYRNMLDDRDYVKFDRILTQFGYKISEPIKKTFLKNRPQFNYVQANGVSIQCSKVPLSVRKDLEGLFKGGVRIWHKKPFNGDYIDNRYKEEV